MGLNESYLDVIKNFPAALDWFGKENADKVTDIQKAISVLASNPEFQKMAQKEYEIDQRNEKIQACVELRKKFFDKK